VDGGINAETGALTVAKGADTLVAGTSVFRAADMGEAIGEMRGKGLLMADRGNEVST
jgi:ribulose-phosphate 3-epimerase